MRTDGRPSGVAVASAAASGSWRSAARASPSQAASVLHGFGSRASSQASVTCGISSPGPRIRCDHGRHAHDRDQDRDPRTAVACARGAGGAGRGGAAARPLADLRSAGGERDDHRRRRQRVRRLCRRCRRGQRRPCASGGRRGGHGAGRAVPPHRLHGRPLRALRRARRAPLRSRADRGRDTCCVLQRRDRGGRERGQAGAPAHGSPGCDRVRGRLPRTHLALHDDDLEVPPVQDRHGALRARGLPRAVPQRVPRAERSGGAGAARADLRGRRAGRADRGDRLRATARGGRLHPRASRSS